MVMASLLFCPCGYAEKESKERPKFSEALKVVTLTYESRISYRDAMTKFYDRKPEGYVMEAMKQYTVKNLFVVKVKMRRP